MVFEVSEVYCGCLSINSTSHDVADLNVKRIVKRIMTPVHRLIPRLIPTDIHGSVMNLIAITQDLQVIE